MYVCSLLTITYAIKYISYRENENDDTNTKHIIIN